MAALTYQRTRLVRAWTHLERQRGGLGFVGGPGETQIEADRRAIDEQIVRMRRQLDKVVKTRELHRAARAKVPFPIVALVGYTNAGKSTLFNRLTGAEVMAKDMLFATLDPTMRGVELPVGPQGDPVATRWASSRTCRPQLVAAFRATLEEVLEADLILHVRDISHPDTTEQAADVDDDPGQPRRARRGAALEVWNKIDQIDAAARSALETQAARSDTTFADLGPDRRGAAGAARRGLGRARRGEDRARDRACLRRRPPPRLAHDNGLVLSETRDRDRLTA